jgi:hypothetical protein
MPDIKWSMTSGQAAIKAASFTLFFPCTVTNAIPAAKKPNAMAITSERVIISTSAVETDAEIPIRIDSFTDATIDLVVHQSLQIFLD